MQEIIAQAGMLFGVGGKILVIVFLVIYLIFAFVIVKQVNLMTKTLELGLETTIRVFAYLHLFFALSVLLISLILL